MSYFQRSDTRVQERRVSPEPPRSPFADVAGRFANWIAGVDRIPPPALDGDEPDGAELDPMRELAPAAPAEEEPRAEETSRFPIAPLGYNRAAVDEALLGLEREITELKASRRTPEVSIAEELERIGEQTASILVVAHDQAHETTRRAREQAERCVADAAANAVAITAEAEERLRELDAETDAVWRERERLLDDVRAVSAALRELADEASDRFPAAEAAMIAAQAADAAEVGSAAVAAFPVAAPAPRRDDGDDEPAAADSAAAEPAAAEPADADPGPRARWETDGDPQATAPFTLEEAEEAQSAPNETSTGDTGSWLAGLEPPEA